MVDSMGKRSVDLLELSLVDYLVDQMESQWDSTTVVQWAEQMAHRKVEKTAAPKVDPKAETRVESMAVE